MSNAIDCFKNEVTSLCFLGLQVAALPTEKLRLLYQLQLLPRTPGQEFKEQLHALMVIVDQQNQIDSLRTHLTEGTMPYPTPFQPPVALTPEQVKDNTQESLPVVKKNAIETKTEGLPVSPGMKVKGKETKGGWSSPPAGDLLFLFTGAVRYMLIDYEMNSIVGSKVTSLPTSGSKVTSPPASGGKAPLVAPPENHVVCVVEEGPPLVSSSELESLMHQRGIAVKRPEPKVDFGRIACSTSIQGQVKETAKTHITERQWNEDVAKLKSLLSDNFPTLHEHKKLQQEILALAKRVWGSCIFPTSQPRIVGGPLDLVHLTSVIGHTHGAESGCGEDEKSCYHFHSVHDLMNKWKETRSGVLHWELNIITTPYQPLPPHFQTSSSVPK